MKEKLLASQIVTRTTSYSLYKLVDRFDLAYTSAPQIDLLAPQDSLSPLLNLSPTL